MVKGLISLVIISVLLVIFYAQPGSTESGGEMETLREDIKALKEGQTAIQKELQEIKTLLRSRQAPPDEPQNVVLDIDGAPIKGDKDAKVTIVEFSDYQCPFCGRHVRDTIPQIKAEYIKTGKVKYVFSDFPLDFHQNAFKAAEAARCAREQGKYWEMHDRLFGNQQALGDLTPHAEAVGLNMSKFQKCMDSGKYAEAVRKDIEEGQKAGVSGTPTFFIGLTDPKDSEVKAVKKIVGAQPYANFKSAIDGLLSAEK